MLEILLMTFVLENSDSRAAGFNLAVILYKLDTIATVLPQKLYLSVPLQLYFSPSYCSITITVPIQPRVGSGA